MPKIDSATISRIRAWIEVDGLVSFPLLPYETSFEYEPMPESMNGAALGALRTAIAACVSSSTDAETCIHAHNPAWHRVAQLLDDCTDSMRELETELTQPQNFPSPPDTPASSQNTPP